MKYIIIKVITKIGSYDVHYDVHYGKMFDSEHDAIEQATKLNRLSKNDCGLVQFAVLPREVTPKGAN